MDTHQYSVVKLAKEHLRRAAILYALALSAGGRLGQGGPTGDE
jgi:hypothetical protein